MHPDHWQAVVTQLRQAFAAAEPATINPQAALQRILAVVCQVEPIAAGIVWMLDEQRQLSMLCDHEFQRLSTDRRFFGQEHRKWLSTVLQEGQTVYAALREEEPSQPPCQLALGPLMRGEQPVGILEFIVLKALTADAQAVLMRGVEDLCEIGSELLADATQQPDEPQQFWERFDRFVLHLQRSLDVDEVAAATANDGLVLLGCDRLSVALRRGSRTQVCAISGQEKVDRRSNLVRHMTALADQAIAAGETVAYRGVTDGLPPQLEKPLSDFVLESRCRMVQLVPLRDSPRSGNANGDPSSERPRPPKVMGCLIVEQMTESRPRPSVSRHIDIVADHSAAALANARAHSELFLLPLWRTLGRGWNWLRGRRLRIAAGIGVLIAAAIAALIVVPWNYRVEATGLLMPAIQRDVFAPWDGDIREVVVASGQTVAAGDLLLRIDSDDLDAEHIAARNEVFEKEKLAATLLAQWQAALQESDREQQHRLQGELTTARVELVAAQQHEEKLAERIEKLSVRAPINGTVVTYQLKQNLLDRPVRRGEVLLEVMDDSGPWRLELEVPEHRMGHLLRALNASDAHTLAVEYVPATAVEQTHRATLTTVGSRSNVSEEQGTVVEVFADVDSQDVPQRRIGAEVTAKIDCGTASLGYVLFGDVIEFLQRTLWF